MDSERRDRIHEIYNAFVEGHFQYLLDEVVHDEIKLRLSCGWDVKLAI
jgi:hypothetical protein